MMQWNNFIGEHCLYICFTQLTYWRNQLGAPASHNSSVFEYIFYQKVLTSGIGGNPPPMGNPGSLKFSQKFEMFLTDGVVCYTTRVPWCHGTFNLSDTRIVGLPSVLGMMLVVLIDDFFKLAKFGANCHLANDWSCFVEHKLLTPFRLTCQGGLVVEFWPNKPEVGVSNPSRGGGIF